MEPAAIVCHAHAAKFLSVPVPCATPHQCTAIQEDPSHVSDASHPHTRRRLAAASVIAGAALALSTAAVLPASASGTAAEGRIENAGAPGTISGSYIVTLDDSAARAGSAQGKALAEEYGAKIKKTYRAALNGYSVELSAAQAKKFAADPAVKSVVQNRTFRVTGTQPSPPSWGLDRIDRSPSR